MKFAFIMKYAYVIDKVNKEASIVKYSTIQNNISIYENGIANYFTFKNSEVIHGKYTIDEVYCYNDTIVQTYNSLQDLLANHLMDII